MSEYIFGPSAEWLPGILPEGESIQPRLDGGYDFKPIRNLGSYAIKESYAPRHNPNQPTLFDEFNEEIALDVELFDKDEDEN